MSERERREEEKKSYRRIPDSCTYQNRSSPYIGKKETQKKGKAAIRKCMRQVSNRAGVENGWLAEGGAASARPLRVLQLTGLQAAPYTAQVSAQTSFC